MRRLSGPSGITRSLSRVRRREAPARRGVALEDHLLIFVKGGIRLVGLALQADEGDLPRGVAFVTLRTFVVEDLDRAVRISRRHVPDAIAVHRIALFAVRNDDERRRRALAAVRGREPGTVRPLRSGGDQVLHHFGLHIIQADRNLSADASVKSAFRTRDAANVASARFRLVDGHGRAGHEPEVEKSGTARLRRVSDQHVRGAKCVGLSHYRLPPRWIASVLFQWVRPDLPAGGDSALRGGRIGTARSRISPAAPLLPRPFSRPAVSLYSPSSYRRGSNGCLVFRRRVVGVVVRIIGRRRRLTGPLDR